MWTRASQVLKRARRRWDERSPGTVVRWGSLYAVFVALNLADLQLTHRLFDLWGSATTELNPLANGLLNSYGWIAVIQLKLTSTAAVGLLLAIVSVCRPRLGRWALRASCLLVGAVVAYNGLLNYFPGMSATRESVAQIQAIRERGERLDRRAHWRRLLPPAARSSAAAREWHRFSRFQSR
jgi:hypothetical protein